MNPGCTARQLQEAVDALNRFGSQSAAARGLGMDRNTFRNRLSAARVKGIEPTTGKPFEAPELPDDGLSDDELIQHRIRQYERKHAYEEARRLIPIKVKIDGPVGIAHFGDPHIDDDGCDLKQLKADVDTVNATKGLFGANLGDLSNNWIGRLAKLWAEQSTSARQAWQLVRWLVGEVQWLYLIGGNHDCWSSAGNADPLEWLMRDQAGVYQSWGVRLALNFPNGKEVRINARHDFVGHSMWNPAHGPSKAIQAGWRDHILTCGHKHTSFIAGPHKCPATGLLSWAVRCAGYKVHDRYATERGLPDQNAFPTAVTIIDPKFADDDPRLITVLPSVQEGAEFLTWKRARTK